MNILPERRHSRKRPSKPAKATADAQPQDNDLAANVERAYDLGFSFTPLRGKIPILKGWQERKRASLKRVLDWAQQGNIGLRTGSASDGITVLDPDHGASTDHLDLPETVTAVTGSGNRHHYFQYDGPLGNSQGKLGEHIDVKADGGQVVFPGSIHPDTGKKYHWLKGHAPWEIDIRRCPRAS